MKKMLKQYADLLAEVDAWFNRCHTAHPQEIACHAGCSACCRGLFDITLLDAYLLKTGFEQLDAETRGRVLGRVAERLALFRATWPEFGAPYVLNYRPEEEWEALMPDEDETPCVLLEDGRCLLYAHRPMTCRLHGIPHVDVSGEVLFDEWCTLNFTTDDPLRRESLRGEFLRIFKDELTLFRAFARSLFKVEMSELDAFIPTALLIDFTGFDWRSWLNRTTLAINSPL